MPLNYNTPDCPNSLPHKQRFLRPEERCPRSDTYRAIESGNAQSVFGWMFRCRTCGIQFFHCTSEMKRHYVREGQVSQSRAVAQKPPKKIFSFGGL